MNGYASRYSFKAGFTLVELLVVVSIVAILAMMAAPNMAGSLRSARVKQTTNDLAADLEKARTDAMSLRLPVTLTTYGGTKTNWIPGVTPASSTAYGGGLVFSTSNLQQLENAKPAWIISKLSSLVAGAVPKANAELLGTRTANKYVTVVPSQSLAGVVFWPDGRVTDLTSTNTVLPQVSFKVCANDAAIEPYTITLRPSGTLIIQKLGVVERC